MNLYQNEDYVVTYDGTSYKVVNTTTGAVEAEDIALPKAMITAKTYGDSLSLFRQQLEKKADVIAIGSKS